MNPRTTAPPRARRGCDGVTTEVITVPPLATLFASLYELTSRVRRFRSTRRGIARMGDIGVALIAVGAVIAIAGLIAVLFVPAATFTTLDADFSVGLGIVFLVLGLVVWAAD
jgi:hypothetical protein